MKPAYPRFLPLEHGGGFSLADVQFFQFPPIVKVHQAAAENERIAERPSPKIRQIYGIEGFSFAKADGFENANWERLGCDGKGERGFSAIGKAAEFERERVGGEQNFLCANRTAMCLYFQRVGELDGIHGSLFENENATFLAGSAEATQDLPGINRSSRNFLYEVELSRIIPADRRLSQRFGAANFVASRKRDFAVDLKRAKNILVPSQDVAKARQIANSALRQSHTAGVTARAVSDQSSFEERDTFSGIEMFQPGSRRKPREASANHSDIDGLRK